MKKLLTDDWKFLNTSFGTELSDVIGEKEKFENVSIPHDFLISDVKRFYEDATGWYYRNLYIEDTARSYELIFDGIYMDSTVYINGQAAGEWKYGYSQFILNITDYLEEGVNEIFVRVNYRCPNSRWYSGAGIYRNVWININESTYIPENGVYIHCDKTKDGYCLSVDTEVCGIKDHGDELFIECRLYDWERKKISIDRLSSGTVGGTFRQKYEVKDIKEWSVEDPNLYTLEVVLQLGEEIIDKKSIQTGFRDIELSPKKGLLLNGNRIKLNGVCIHHDLGALGSAYNNAAMKRRLLQLKDMGVNAIRLSHNMYDPQTLDLMDEMGFLAISESFDMWERSKTDYDYARFFKEWHKKDVESWIKRDRNHPCVFLWSIGNEIYDTHADSRGLDITKELKELTEKYDYMKNAHPTFGSNYMPWENAQKCADVLKIVGYNYAENYYEDHHNTHPDWVIYGSETYSVVQSRGVYHFPLSESILADTDLQCSSLGNSTTSWGADSIEDCICKDRDTDFSMGQFLWTGYDYIGEPTPYHTKNSYFGLIDTAGFYKDAYFIWKGAWTDYRKKPFIHVFPYWDFNEGQSIDVRVATNAPFVELFLNGQSLGKQEIDHGPHSGKHVIADYKVKYRAGELKALAYDENGSIIAEEVKKSFGETKDFRIDVEKGELYFASISAIDENGNIVENARDTVRVTVQGGKLLGLDNGDSTDNTSYQSDTKALFSGKLLAIVEPFPGEDVRICVERAGGEISVRAIKLEACGERNLTPFNKSVRVRAEVLPKNATSKEIHFELLNKKGTKSNLALLLASDDSCEITGLYDGEFVLRCSFFDKEGIAKVISTLEFNISDMGTAYLDPYDFISGNAYSDHRGRVSSGNEHGVATDRGKETVVIYRGIDFGSQGSDVITVPIFALSDDEYPIQIIDGIPGEEKSEVLADVVYHKKSIWNVYQEDSWKMKKRLTGIKTLSFVTHDKIHIKGFSFERQLKAMNNNSALEADSIYGDSFIRTKESVEGIGNNVTFAFSDMDFGSIGIKEIVICGRAKEKSNTLHLRMKKKGVETSVKEVLEFPKCSEYSEISFRIEPQEGIWDIEFIFLPGSNFDFKHFRFR